VKWELDDSETVEPMTGLANGELFMWQFLAQECRERRYRYGSFDSDKKKWTFDPQLSIPFRGRHHEWSFGLADSEPRLTINPGYSPMV